MEKGLSAYQPIPKDDSINRTLLSTYSTESPKVYLGMEGWNDRSLLGKFYKKGTPPNRFLEQYQQYFNCAEISSSKFQLPKAEELQELQNRVSSSFKFHLKIPQYIAASRNLLSKDNLKDLDEYLGVIRCIEKNVGSLCLEIPTKFHKSRLSDLEKFIEYLPQDYSCALEIKNSSFFEDESYLHLKKLMAEFNLGFVMNDNAEYPKRLHTAVSGNMAFLHFEGKNRMEDFGRATQWAETIKQWLEQGISKAFILVKQPAPHRYASIELAEAVLKVLEEFIPKDECELLRNPRG